MSGDGCSSSYEFRVMSLFWCLILSLEYWESYSYLLPSRQKILFYPLFFEIDPASGEIEI